MATNSPALIVPAPGAPDVLTNDIRGIKPPVVIPNEWAWLWWTLGLLLLAGLAAGAFFWWHRNKVRAAVVPVIPPHVRARNKLAQALSLLHDPRLFCILVSDTLRVYLEERFDFRAPERTTEEFMLELQASRLLTPDQKQSLGEFLQACDLVKFARHEPPETELRALLDSALRLIDETRYEPLPTPASSASGPPPLPPVTLRPEPAPPKAATPAS
jgi:hypothetical protein